MFAATKAVATAAASGGVKGAAAAPPFLSRIVFMVRSSTTGENALLKAVDFYTSALHLPVRRVTDEWAELEANPYTILQLQMVTSESQVATGYSPILNFHIEPHGPISFEETVTACVQAGAHLDGPIQFPAHGKVAAFRTPDGHMIGLYAPAVSSNTPS